MIHFAQAEFGIEQAPSMSRAYSIPFRLSSPFASRYVLFKSIEKCSSRAILPSIESSSISRVIHCAILESAQATDQSLLN
jgi:hypothetical protein